MQHILASRMERLLANFIDAIILVSCTGPILYLIGFFESASYLATSQGNAPPTMEALGYQALSIVVFLVIHGKWLLHNGQTLGKKVMNVQIVDLQGNIPTPVALLLKRYGFFFVIGIVPLVGSLLSLISILLIFGAARRCGHDFIAGTKVITLDPPLEDEE